MDLVEEAGTRAQYAMKRIQCPEQADVECAMKEAEYHRIFDEDTIVRLLLPSHCLSTTNQPVTTHHPRHSGYPLLQAGRSTSRESNSMVLRRQVTLVDADVVDSKAVPGQKEVVLLFPLYQQGTLQDRITKMAANGTRFSEHELVSIFRGICLGVRHLHQCSVSSCRRMAALSRLMDKAAAERWSHFSDHALCR